MPAKQKTKPARKPRPAAAKPAPGAAAASRAARVNTLRCNLYLSADDLRLLAFAKIENLPAVIFLRAIVAAEMLATAARMSPAEIVMGWESLETFARDTLASLR